MRGRVCNGCGQLLTLHVAMTLGTHAVHPKTVKHTITSTCYYAMLHGPPMTLHCAIGRGRPLTFRSAMWQTAHLTLFNVANRSPCTLQ